MSRRHKGRETRPACNPHNTTHIPYLGDSSGPCEESDAALLHENGAKVKNEISAKRGSGDPQSRTKERANHAEADRKKRDRVRKRKDWTIETAHRALVENVQDMRELAIKSTSRWRIPDQTRDNLHALWGSPGMPTNVLASNLRLREEVGKAVIDEALRIQRRHPDWGWYSATFIDDRVRTTDVLAQINFTSLVRSVRRMLRDADIRHWFGVIEFQPFSNWRRGSGRDVAPHVHVIFCTGKNIKRGKLARRMRNSTRLFSATQAPTVTIKKRKRLEGEIAHMMQYLFKAPLKAANCFRRRDGKWTQRDARQRGDQAVRMMEILSHFELDELIVRSGHGKALKHAAAAVINRARHAPGAIKIAQVQGIWERARRAAGKTRYRPVTVIRK